MMLLEEMASIFVTPYLLIFVVPRVKLVAALKLDLLRSYVNLVNVFLLIHSMLMIFYNSFQTLRCMLMVLAMFAG